MHDIKGAKCKTLESSKCWQGDGAMENHYILPVRVKTEVVPLENILSLSCKTEHLHVIKP